ncbi:MAG: superoxide dismutase family protein [Rhodospirillales bacterium]|nr:superoxide dismutase family protein [Rhodospirillales bacterium]
MFKIAAASLLAITATSGAQAAETSGGATAEAALRGPDGASMGEAMLESTPHGVLVHVRVEGLSPGAHGIHLHAVGSCSPDFKAAGGHIRTSGNEHGLRNPKGPEAGDLPNLYAAADGRAEAEFFTALVDMKTLLDSDGSAVVIHAHPDDQLTQPIGGSGDRVACGVIKAS